MHSMLLTSDKDPMGAAIIDYLAHGKASKLRVFSSMFDEDEIPVNQLFRTFQEMPSLEQKALQLSTGKILDVGAGSGCHTLALQEMGKEVTAIDISPLSVEAMNKRGVKDARLQNFFDKSLTGPFDTILLLMNGSGIIGKLENLPAFFHRLKEVLARDGQLLLDSSDLSYLSLHFLGILLLSLVCLSAGAESQRKLTSYQKYISKYSDLAIQHQKKYRIPASITLAQGLLESGAGQSDLARRSNNHFGIKCHSDWRGGRVYHDDDLRGECFRKYKRVEDSYDDHSRFLAERSRYERLFKLNIKDYKGWAKGLQKCGYATDRAYANKLIKVIEDYELYRFDSGKGTKKTSTKRQNLPVFNYQVYRTHGLIYVYAKDNDSFDQIARSMGFKAKQLMKFNEVPEDFPLQAGDIVYLEKKKKKADKPNYDHVVQVGESMHSIAQMYGIQIKSLYKMNKKDKDYIPEEGDVLKLR